MLHVRALPFEVDFEQDIWAMNCMSRTWNAHGWSDVHFQGQVMEDTQQTESSAMTCERGIIQP